MNKDIKFKSCYRVAPNIALIKYWGKFDQEWILPLNSSISVTLSCQDLFSQTKVTFLNSANIKSDCLILNNKEDEITGRIQKILNFFRENTKQLVKENNVIDQAMIKQMHFIIKSENNFPTAAGLASSSSGLACIGWVLVVHAEAYMAELQSEQASAKKYWLKKGNSIQMNSKYFQNNVLLNKLNIFQKDEIAKYEILVVIGDLNQKKIKSTIGMQQTVETSEFLKYRVRELVSDKIQKLKVALKEKDINATAKIIMEDSNQFHATCLDTMPPLFYLNQLSQNIIQFVHEFNFNSNLHVAYTFDAGPNAVLLIPQESYIAFMQLFWDSFQIAQKFKQIKFVPEEHFENFQNLFLKHKNTFEIEKFENTPHMLIKTQIGDGPVQIN